MINTSAHNNALKSPVESKWHVLNYNLNCVSNAPISTRYANGILNNQSYYSR